MPFVESLDKQRRVQVVLSAGLTKLISFVKEYEHVIVWNSCHRTRQELQNVTGIQILIQTQKRVGIKNIGNWNTKTWNSCDQGIVEQMNQNNYTPIMKEINRKSNRDYTLFTQWSIKYETEGYMYPASGRVWTGILQHAQQDGFELWHCVAPRVLVMSRAV